MRRTSAFFKLRWPLIVVLSAVFLQPFGRLVELPVLIMAIVGLYLLVRRPRSTCSTLSFKVLTAIFVCFWLPAVFSLPDAVNIQKSISSCIGMLRFYFAGIFVINYLSTSENLKLVAVGLASIAVFWASGNMFQAAFGVDFFGRPALSGRIPGIFGDSPRSGWMLMPIAFVTITYFWQRLKKPISIPLISVVMLAIFVSGDRGAIVAMFWALLALGVFALLRGYRPHPKSLVLGGTMVSLLFLAVYQVPQVKGRFHQTVAVFNEGTFDAWDRATSGRLTLWNTAFEVVEDNIVNGVGVRGFRYAYPEYAPDGDRFVLGDTGAYHAHQVVIEVLADTGLLGLLGYVMAIGIFVWLMREALRRKTYLALGYLASVVGVLMPINSHLSMYSSYWAQACWFLFAVAVATVFYETQETEKAEV